MRARPSAALLLVVLLSVACSTAPRQEPPAGAVASAATDATQAGLAVLAAGGNAADAAVATALALAVVHPEAGNLGGGGFAVVRASGQLAALDFRETAPAAARRAMYLDDDGAPRRDASLVGPLAAGVPGSPAGLFELHRRYGRLPWADVVAPAIRLARDGFALPERVAEGIGRARALLERFPETAAVWLPGGAPPAAGTTMRLPRLAALLAAYAAQGPVAITSGPAAAAIEAASSRHGGVLTAADLDDYRPVWRQPLRLEGFGWQIAAMPLPSSGGVILGQTLGLLERLDWAALPRDGADRAHLLAESWRRAFADRVLLGDPATTRAREEELLAADWLDARARSVDREHGTVSASLAPWPGRQRVERLETTHLSVVDGEGNAVALTTTLNGSFGCGLLVPELELLLNNEMDDFTTAPGRPNLFGLIQGEANEVGPGKRMLSSMTPTIAWRDGEVLVLGSPGGSTIPTATAQVLLAVLVDQMPLEQAVAAPRLHHQWLPDELRHETAALDAATRAELERRGHALRQVVRLGEVHAVRRAPDGRVEAAADARGPGAAGTTGSR